MVLFFNGVPLSLSFSLSLSIYLSFSILPRDLLKLASSKLGPIVGQGSPYADPKGDDKEILDLLNFFQESSAQVIICFY